MGLGESKLSFLGYTLEQVPEGKMPRWAVLGRSNVGKSSFLNALVHARKHFHTSAQPGKTRSLVGVEVVLGRAKEARLELIDLPGYGFAKGAKEAERDLWLALADTLRERSREKSLHWIWLADPLRVPAAEEFEVAKWLRREPYSLVFTKSDQVSKGKRASVEKAWGALIETSTEKPFWVSSLKGEGLDAVQASARAYVRACAEGL